jgi:hypothetical protein
MDEMTGEKLAGFGETARMVREAVHQMTPFRPMAASTD